jgi:hypothetical protein
MLAQNLANAEGEWTFHINIMPPKRRIVKHPILVRLSFLSAGELLLAASGVILTNLQGIQ